MLSTFHVQGGVLASLRVTRTAPYAACVAGGAVLGLQNGLKNMRNVSEECIECIGAGMSMPPNQHAEGVSLCLQKI